MMDIGIYSINGARYMIGEEPIWVTAQETKNNKEKFKNQAIASSQFLAAIYNNTKKNRDSAIYFLQKGLEFDPANTTLSDFLKELQKPAGKPTKGKPTGSTKPNAMKSLATKNKNVGIAKS